MDSSFQFRNKALHGDIGGQYRIEFAAKSFPSLAGQEFVVAVRLGDCLPGEIYQKSQRQCYVCDRETYSLRVNSLACAPCPQGQKCLGGNVINISAGFWR